MSIPLQVIKDIGRLIVLIRVSPYLAFLVIVAIT